MGDVAKMMFILLTAFGIMFGLLFITQVTMRPTVLPVEAEGEIEVYEFVADTEFDESTFGGTEDGNWTTGNWSRTPGERTGYLYIEIDDGFMEDVEIQVIRTDGATVDDYVELVPEDSTLLDEDGEVYIAITWEEDEGEFTATIPRLPEGEYYLRLVEGVYKDVSAVTVAQEVFNEVSIDGKGGDVTSASENIKGLI